MQNKEKELENLNSQEYTGNNLVFIVGCPRSGTTFVQRLLGSNPQIRTTRETHLFDAYLGEDVRSWRGEIEKASSNPWAVGISWYLGEDYFLSALREYAYNLIKPHISDLKAGQLFIEKTPNHAEYIPEILAVFPECKVIHIVRDPRDVVASLIAAAKSWAKYFPKSALSAAKMWVRYINAVHSSQNLLGKDQFYQLKYEHLLTSTRDVVESLSEFLGVQWKQEDLENAISENDATSKIRKRGGEDPAKFLRKARPGSWKEDLNWKQKLDVWRVARKTMSELDYPWKYPW